MQKIDERRLPGNLTQRKLNACWADASDKRDNENGLEPENINVLPRYMVDLDELKIVSH